MIVPFRDSFLDPAIRILFFLLDALLKLELLARKLLPVRLNVQLVRVLEVIELALQRQIFAPVIFGHLLIVALEFVGFGELGCERLDFFLVGSFKS